MSAVVCGVIPARYASSRLPGKPLVDICGKPMVIRVYERASASRSLDHLLVATDDGRIAAVCREHGVPVVMTPSELKSGSDRVFAALGGMEYDIAVNIQGDEPLLDPAVLAVLLQPLRALVGTEAVATLRAPIERAEDALCPAVVKVVCGVRGQALYFSRSPIPSGGGTLEQHIGLYAFTRQALSRFVKLPPGELEQREKLEQLRLLENGIPIFTSRVAAHGPSVDTPEDLERVRVLFRESGDGGCTRGY